MAERCADVSARSGEPLAGTAAEAARWLMVEERGAWAPAIFDSPGLGSLAARLRSWDAADPELRVQLIRRPGRRAGPRKVFVVDAIAGGAWVHGLSEPELLSFDLGAALAGRSGEPLERPLHLVCTHGKRDDCCALRGVPVHRALARAAAGASPSERPEVWQTSHLGGHRFAATLVTLPHGYFLGRVTPEEAAAIVATGGLHDLDRVRGRCQWPKAAQVADVEARRRLWAPGQPARLDPDALRLREIRDHDDGWIVRFEIVRMDAEGDAAGAVSFHEVHVRSEMPSTIQPKSCGDAPVSVSRLLAAKARP